MTPSELLRLELDLRKLGNDYFYERALIDFLDATDRAVQSSPNIFGSGVKNSYENVKRQAQEAVRRLHGPVIDLADHLQEIRRPLEKTIADNFEDLYSKTQRDNLTFKWIRKTLPVPNEDDLENFLALVRNCSNWKFAGCVIRPVNQIILNQLVACDPLYVMDYNISLVDTYLESFPEIYRNRVRKLQLVNQDFQESARLSALPHNQLGIIVAYNFFNFMPLSVLSRYLREIYVKLKPGGSLIFTYNNCNYPHGLSLSESMQFGYQDYNEIIKVLKEIGYSIEHEFTNEIDFHYIHVVKSGTLDSIRGGQTLMKVSHKQTYDIENAPENHGPEDVYKAKMNTFFNVDTALNLSKYSMNNFRNHVLTIEKLIGLIDFDVSKVSHEVFNKKRR